MCDDIDIHPKVKITACLCYLAYGCLVDSPDEVSYIGKNYPQYSLNFFCVANERLFGDTYLGMLNDANITRILVEFERRGWSGCLGSLDCMQWEWKNCPSQWRGQY